MAAAAPLRRLAGAAPPSPPSMVSAAAAAGLCALPAGELRAPAPGGGKRGKKGKRGGGPGRLHRRFGKFWGAASGAGPAGDGGSRGGAAPAAGPAGREAGFGILWVGWGLVGCWPGLLCDLGQVSPCAVAPLPLLKLSRAPRRIAVSRESAPEACLFS